MSNSNGVIFVDATGTPIQGVSITDVQTVLNLPSQNGIVGLIANGDINKWAKYKPVKNHGVGFASQRNSDFTWKTTATWWKAYNGQCGLTFSTFNSIGTNTMSTSGTFFHDLLAGGLNWGYERPTGGSVSQYPYRYLDFNYYDHNAPKPVTGVYDNLRLYGGGKLTVQLDESRAANNLGIQLSDISINNVSAWYVGVLIWKSNNQYAFAFSENTIGNGSIDVEFTNMTAYGGQTATVVPFLSSVRANQGNDPGAGIFLSCDVAPQTLTIRAEVQAVTMTINAQWRETLHVRVGYDVRIFNNTGSQVTVNNLSIALYDGYQNIDVDSVGTVTIAANDFHDETGILLANPYYADRTYKVVVSSSRAEVNGEVVVDEPRT